MAKIRRFLELYYKFFICHRTPVIVFSMERSGSIALFHSLVSHGELVLQTHCLDPFKIKTGQVSGSARWALRHVFNKQKNAKIISLVRDPLQSIVSHYARLNFSPRLAGRKQSAADIRDLSGEEISKIFETEFLEEKHFRHHLEWFDCEFKEPLGVDVFQYPFNKKEGYVRIRKEPYDILILRTEMANSEKSQHVSEFLGLEGFQMQKKNMARGADPGTPGEQSPYSKMYKILKSQLVIPDKYLDEIVDSKHVTHFFTQDSIEAMKQQFKS